MTTDIERRTKALLAAEQAINEASSLLETFKSFGADEDEKELADSARYKLEAVGRIIQGLQ